MTLRMFVGRIEIHGLSLFRSNEAGHGSRRWATSVLRSLKIGKCLDVGAQWDPDDYVRRYVRTISEISKSLDRYDGIASDEGSYFGFEISIIRAEHERLKESHCRANEAEEKRLQWVGWAKGVVSDWYMWREQCMALNYHPDEIEYVA